MADEEQPQPPAGDESRMSRWLNRARSLARRLDPEEPTPRIVGSLPPPRASMSPEEVAARASRNLEQIAEELDEPVAPGQPSLFDAPPPPERVAERPPEPPPAPAPTPAAPPPPMAPPILEATVEADPEPERILEPAAIEEPEPVFALAAPEVSEEPPFAPAVDEPEPVVALAAPKASEEPSVAPLIEEPAPAIVFAAPPPAEVIETPMPPPLPPLTVEAEETPLPDPDAESPEEIAEEEREADLIAKGGPFSRFAWPTHPHYWNGYLALLTGLTTLAFLMFVLVEPSPRWILLVVALAVTAGLDGALRATWRVPFASGDDTTPYLFLPALYVFAAPLLIEHNVAGHVAILWALLAGVGFGAVVVAEVLSVRTGSRLYPYARMVTTGTAYIAAFSLFSMTYVLNLGLIPALLATWFLGTMLAIEVVREGEVDPAETVIFGALVGLMVAQVRWLLFYLPVDGYLAGLTLVLVFYLVTGVLHSYVTRQLTTITATEYALVTTIGVILVGAARVAGLA